MHNVVVLGATGSIGQSTLDVIARHPDRLRLAAASAFTRGRELIDICAKFRPDIAVVGTAQGARSIAAELRSVSPATTLLHGEQGLIEAAGMQGADTVLAAIVGAAGLRPTLAAARAGKRVLLANKEALVMTGRLFIDAVAASGATLLPIDSEHNAIFQCLPRGASQQLASHGVRRVLLTGSGGPFRTRPLESLDAVTPAEACKHPTWDMGPKISVDSATMANKALEIIEAHWLFGAAPEQIEVVIHPQSVIHSMVEYHDGSVLAQLGNPDMRTPIAHALAFPERIHAGVSALDLVRIGQLTFEAADFRRFPALRLAYEVLRAPDSAAVAFNAANEVAVAAFLAGRLKFPGLIDLVEATLNAIDHTAMRSVEEVVAFDARARETADTHLRAFA